MTTISPHIDDKVEMYDLLLTMARKAREQLASGNAAAAMRVLAKYEQEAREVFSEWDIPESYIESGDEDELYELLSDELLIPGSGDLTGVGQFEARHSQPDYPALMRRSTTVAMRIPTGMPVKTARPRNCWKSPQS